MGTYSTYSSALWKQMSLDLIGKKMEYFGLSAVALGSLGCGHQIAKERGGTGTATERALVSTFSPCHQPIPEMEQIMSIGLLYGIV